jgi:hypothetical protein
MSIARHFKPSLFVLAGLAAAASPPQATAAPVYLLLEGTITSNTETVSCVFCEPTSPHTGKAIKIEAIWDDAKIFGGNASTVPGQGHFGSNGWGGQMDIWGSDNDINYFPLAGAYAVDTWLTWQYYTMTIGTAAPSQITLLANNGNHGQWKIDLATEDNGASGDRVSLSFKGQPGEWPHFSNNYSFSFDLQDASQTALDSQLFGFNWNTSKGGTATGTTKASGSHGPEVRTSTNEITWSRAVLTYNPADLAAVPVPASAWLFGSAVLSLLGGRRLRSRK